MLNVIITFDYEIFFGKNYVSEKEVLFDSTDQLLDLLERHGLQSVFFADVLSVDAYIKNNPGNDYPIRFSNQIKKMNLRGQDVQLHIHPHWITARFNRDNNQWVIDPKRYRIHSFLENANHEISAEDIIGSSINYLNSVLMPLDDTYECYAYRAGGYCIQPENELFPILAKHGIEIDSSVCIGKKLHSEAHYFDFDKDYKELNWEIASGIMELPIGSVNNNLIRRFIPNSGFKTLEKKPSKGEGIAGTTKPMQNRLSRLLSYNRSFKEFGLEFMHYKQMLYGLKEYYRKYNCKNEDKYVAVICHPKSMDEIAMKNMDFFIQKVKESDWVSFSTLKEMRKAVGKK